jgi:hypothetical protein
VGLKKSAMSARQPLWGALASPGRSAVTPLRAAPRPEAGLLIPRAVEADWIGDGTGIEELECTRSKSVRAQGQPGLQVGGGLHHETARRRTANAEAESGVGNGLRILKDRPKFPT